MLMLFITQNGKKQRLKNRFVTFNCSKKFGMISDNKIVKELKRSKAIALYDCKQGVYFNLVPVVNIYVYVVSNELDSYCEYNASTKILSSENSFWVTNEFEYKIETSTPVPIESIIAAECNGHFCFSKATSQTSFERYYKYIQGSHVEYVDILGKRNWKRPMAFKHKKLLAVEPILARKVNLLPYSERDLDDYMNSLFEISLPISRKMQDAFYKKKDRSICIDVNKGIIFGVSSSVATPLSQRRRNLNQIEIEYWSQIIRSSDLEKMYCKKGIDYDSFDDLINWLKDKLGIPYKAPGCMKIEWLEE